MSRHRAVVTIAVILATAHCAQAQAGSAFSRDSAFRAVQERGRQIMGVDQYTSQHQFDLLPNGGRIALQRDDTDRAGTAAIRAHLHLIARAFAAGDFSSPFLVHDREVPGTATMIARRRAISYRMHALPRGGEVLITTRDAVARRAIREFLQFQRSDHRADGMDSTLHSMHHRKP
jgi:uncharacterized protein YjhX (UPF0386 family)